MSSIDKDRWQRVSPLLDALLDEDASARQQRLRQVRDEDATLADEVEALLAREAAVETGQFLEHSPLDHLQSPNLEGRVVGHYTLTRPIGEGGMGSVWLARRSDGRYEGTVAIKFLHLSLLGKGGAERFQREARALARLSHPHITRLLDAGVSDGQPYLVLEHIEGEPIDRWCNGRQLGVRARLRLTLQILEAVAHAHSRLILHRDLKPSNVLVTADGQAKLLDFGIAKLLQDDDSGADPGTLAQAFTPDYAAPEQLAREEVSSASDVYSLGVMLYVLLCGEHPTAKQQTGVERLRALHEAEPIPASKAALRASPGLAAARGSTPAQLSQRLRGDLDQILQKALHKSPELRYASVQSFAEDLGRHLRHEPVSARPSSWGYRAGRFIRRHRTVVCAGVASVVSLVAAVVVTTRQAVEARRQRAEAQAQAERSETARRMMTLMITEVGDGTRPVTPLELIDRGVAMLDAQRHDPRLLSVQLMEMASNYLKIEQPEKARVLLLRAETLARETGDNELVADVQCDLADLDVANGDREVAVRRLDEAESLLASVPRPSPVRRAGCWRVRAALLAAAGNHREALAVARNAAAFLDANGLANHTMKVPLLTQMSEYHQQLYEFPQAFEANRQAGEQLDREGLGGSSARLVTFSNEAVDLSNFGEFAGSAKVLAELRRRLDARGPDVPRASVDTNYGIVLANIGRTEEAIQVLDKAITTARARKDLGMELRARAYRTRALLFAGRLQDARTELDLVEKAYRRDAPANQGILQTITLVRVDWLMRSRMPEDAWPLIEGLIHEIDTVPPKGPLAAALTFGAEVACARGDLDTAKSLADRALALSTNQARSPAHSAFVGRAQLARARVLRARSDHEGARQAYNAAAISLANGLSPDHPMTREARDGLKALASIAPKR